jgi:YVTN family beta-propeller protein
VKVPVGRRPYGIVVSPDGGRVYAANYDSGSVSVIDSATNRVVDTISGLTVPFSLDLTSDGTRLFVGTGNGVLYSINLQSPGTRTSRTLGSAIYGVSINRVTNLIYVPLYGGYTIVILDLNLNTIRTIYLGKPSLNIAFSPDGGKGYVTTRYPDSLTVIDTATQSAVRTLQVGASPWGVAVGGSNARAHVANRDSHSLSVIDTDTDTVVDTLTAAAAGTSFGTVQDAGYQDLTITDMEFPYGILVTADPAGGSVPAKILACGSQYAATCLAGCIKEVYCGSSTVNVFAGIVDIEFTTPEGGVGYAQVAAGNGLTLHPAEFPFDPPFSITAPATNADPIIVYINEQPITITPGASSVHSDADGIADEVDNCPTTSNPDQADVNGDGYGDACVSLQAIIARGVRLGYNPVVEKGTVIHEDVTIGDNTTIGSSVNIKKDVTLGTRVKVGANSTIDTGTSLGDWVTLQPNVSIDRQVQIKDLVLIGENATIKKNCVINNNVLVGSNTKIEKDVTIGENSIIGNNVLIEKNTVIPDGSVIPDGAVL